MRRSSRQSADRRCSHTSYSTTSLLLSAEISNRLYKLGLSLSVNTDARTITDITLGEEYEKLHRFFAWDTQHFLHCNLEALRASFLPEPIRQRLAAQLQESYRTL